MLNVWLHAAGPATAPRACAARSFSLCPPSLLPFSQLHTFCTRAGLLFSDAGSCLPQDASALQLLMAPAPLAATLPRPPADNANCICTAPASCR